MKVAIRHGSLRGLLLPLLLAGCTGTCGSPATVQTTNKEPAWHQQFLWGRITLLQPEGGGVKVAGNVFDAAEPQTKVLPAGHTITFPDDHGMKSYTIASITDRGVVFQYKSVFDHRSFGKNLIETDEGSFLLEWMPPPAAATPMESFNLRSHWAQGRIGLQLIGEDKGFRVGWLLPQKIEREITAELDPSVRYPEVLLYRGEEQRFLAPSGSPPPPWASERALSGTLVCVPEGGKMVHITLRNLRFKNVQFGQIGPIRVELGQSPPP